MARRTLKYGAILNAVPTINAEKNRFKSLNVAFVLEAGLFDLGFGPALT
jgi:hypothetical protein